MNPEEFAKQFFDLWQHSAGQMMRDPAFSQKMLELMQQSGQFWQNAGVSSPYHSSTSAAGAATDDGAGAKSVDELAHRLELCEQRLAGIETLIRHWANATTELSGSAVSRGDSPE
jgi:hypothetical protein